MKNKMIAYLFNTMLLFFFCKKEILRNEKCFYTAENNLKSFALGRKLSTFVLFLFLFILENFKHVQK